MTSDVPVLHVYCILSPYAKLDCSVWAYLINSVTQSYSKKHLNFSATANSPGHVSLCSEFQSYCLTIGFTDCSVIL